MQRKHLPGNEMLEADEYDEDNCSASKYKNSKVHVHVYKSRFSCHTAYLQVMHM